MDAKNINGLVKKLPNFGGIFDASQLDKVKILGLPVSLIVNANEHWLGIYLDSENMEIMDSLGELQNSMKNKELCRFVCAHLLGKKFVSTPQLQSNSSSDCGMYAVSFLWYRSFTESSLIKFSEIFDQNFEYNSEKISEIFKTVKAINESS